MSGRLSYAASSQLAISFLWHRVSLQRYDHGGGEEEITKEKLHGPDGAHQTVDKELVFLRRSLLSCIPDFTVATFHEPPLEIDGVPDERIRDEFVGGEREGLERRVEIGDAVLDE